MVFVPDQVSIDAKLGVYELNRVELLRDVVAWAYERSCQQYLAVRQELRPPDAFRLRHRQSLGAAVRAVVLARQPLTREAVATGRRC